VTFSDFYFFFYCCYYYYYDKDEAGAADFNDAKLFCRPGGILWEFMN